MTLFQCLLLYSSSDVVSQLSAEPESTYGHFSPGNTCSTWCDLALLIETLYMPTNNCYLFHNASFLAVWHEGLLAPTSFNVEITKVNKEAMVSIPDAPIRPVFNYLSLVMTGNLITVSLTVPGAYCAWKNRYGASFPTILLLLSSTCGPLGPHHTTGLAIQKCCITELELINLMAPFQLWLFYDSIM